MFTRRDVLKHSSIALPLASTGAAATPGRGKAKGRNKQRVFVHPKSKNQQAAVDAVADMAGRVIHEYQNHAFIAAELPAQAAARRHNVDFEPDATVSVESNTLTQTVDTQSTPWGIERIEAHDAHILEYTGTDTSIAILDTGIGKNHRELKPNIAGGVNMRGGDDFFDQHGHGTHVAGIAAATHETDTEIVGVAPDADLYAVKVLGENGGGYLSDIVAGLDWCQSNDIDVANLSLGWGSHVDAVKKACDSLAQDGTFIATSAGNSGNDGDGDCAERNQSFPSIYASTVAVGATTKQDEVAPFSSVGENLDLVAPGAHVPSCDIMNSYSYKSGTSMASPHVAGAAAVRYQDDDRSAEALGNLRGELKKDAEELDGTCDEGAGLVRPDVGLFDVTVW